MPRHSESRILPYTPEALYTIVADVKKYAEFLPWVIGAEMIKDTDRGFIADLTVGYRFFKETYRCEVILTPYEAIEVRYIKGPFKHLFNTWTFSPAPPNHVKIDFFIDFDFESYLLQGMVQSLFIGMVPKMIAAFEDRARVSVK